MNTEHIDGEYYYRGGGLTLPLPMPGMGPLDPQLKTKVTISMEIEGGGIPEGQTVTVNFAPLTLTKAEQLKVDLMTRAPEFDDSLVPHLGIPHQLLRLTLEPTLITEDHVFVITLPEGMRKL